MSTQETMKQKLSALLKKRDIELRLAKQKVQEDIEKLRKLFAEIEKEESDVQKEINVLLENSSFAGVTQSNKSILDLPHFAWTIIPTYFEGREYCLLNACLSSPSLEQMITNGSPKEKLRLLGEKVFSLLILSYYVSRRDLQNCLNTPCQDLQFFAGSSWWCFGKSLGCRDWRLSIGKSIHIRTFDQIKEFSKQAEQQTNKWDFFKNMYLTFSYDCWGTKSEYDKFCEAAILLQKRFGKYITFVIWRDLIPGSQQLYDICTNVYIIFPRLKRLSWHIDTIDILCRPSISSQLTARTVEPFFTLHNNFCIPTITAFNHSEGNIHGCNIQSSKLKNAVQLFASKQLTIYMSSSDNVVESYNNVLAADPSNFLNVRSLIVDGYTNHSRSIPMLEKFPNLTDVSMLIKNNIFPRDINGLNPDLVFPRVRKLTIGIIYEASLSLDIVRKYFPLLMCLTITDNEYDEGFRFEDRMSKWRRMRYYFSREVIDVYRLYSMNQSLHKSNIWHEMPHLITFCIDTKYTFGRSEHLLCDDENREVFRRRQEIYRRTETGRILLDIIFV